MPEEIVDLTGSRINDERYANNVIFDKDGLNELLGKIRDYPIVDVDYISENETDEINDTPVWQTYTDDTPCIKVIYGDKTNPSGNLDDTTLQTIRELKKSIALYNSVYNLYNKYKVIENEYTTLIQNIQDELKSIVINVCNTYHNYLNSGDNAPSSASDFHGTYYEMCANTSEGNISGLTDFNNHIYPGNDGYQGLYYKIEFNVAEILDYLEDIIESNDAINALEFYDINYTTRGNTVVNPAVTNNSTNFYVIPLMGQRANYTDEEIKNVAWTGRDLFDTLHVGTWAIDSLAEQLKTYNNLLQQTIETLTYKYVVFDTTGQTPSNSVAYYTYDEEHGYTWQKGLSSFNNNTTYYVRQGSDGTDHIRSLLATYAGYIRQARVNQMEAIRQYLLTKNVTDSALDTAIVTYNDTAYQAVATYVNNNYLNVDVETISAQIQSILDTAVTSRYTTASVYTTGTQYYELDNDGRFMPVSIADETAYNNNLPLYTLTTGAPAIYGYKYVKVGSNITWVNNTDTISEVTTTAGKQHYGTFRITINGHTYEVPIKGFGASTTGAFVSSGTIRPSVNSTTSQTSSPDHGYDLGSSAMQWSTLYARGAVFGNENSGGASNVRPGVANTGNLGTDDYPWGNAYITTAQPASTSGSSVGTSETPYGSGYFGSITIGTGTGAYTIGPGSGSGNGTQYITTSGPINYIDIANDIDAIKQGSGTTATVGFDSNYNGTYYGNTTASIRTSGGIYAAKNIWGARVFNAVFNDYAEYRKTCEGVKPGQCVYEKDDGSLAITDHFLMPGAQVVSDTFGHIMGGSEECTTPLAVAGRVLVYPYQDRKNYHAGMCVCAAPGGTVNIMSRKDIMEYPDCIVGIVSEIPDYETWGTDNIKVDGRIWIKVR